MNHVPILRSEPAESIRPLSKREFEQIRGLAYDKFGLDLRDGKEHLVSARLMKRIRETGCRSFQEYFQLVSEDRSGETLTAMIDALTTNYTSFFREPAHFDFLRTTILPDLRQRDSIKIWSAACATGEEPYSIAVCLHEELGSVAPNRIRILATDISTRALATARKAVYRADGLRALPLDTLRRYLLRGSQQSEGLFRMKPEICADVTFQQINLMEPVSNLGPFPLIFCRNVMIYFDKVTQTGVVNRLADRLEPGGYLFIGHAESLNGIDHCLQYVKPAIYRKPAGNPSTLERRRLRK